MLEDVASMRKVVIACGYVDLRKGIDGLSMICCRIPCPVYFNLFAGFAHPAGCNSKTVNT
ncbi:MAG: hypothetical protein J6B50_05405 [Lachnospiraceae bacterium]|nr:hypothetical protein [Lachnospiraceae bacterium]